MERNGDGVPTKSLRERRKEETARELRAAAVELFKERGFAGTSVDEIAAAAGVSRSTFFRYFASKDDVLLGDAENNARLFIEMLQRRPSSESRLRALEETLIEFADALGSDERRPELRPIDSVIASEPTLQQRRASIAAKWQEEVAWALGTRSGNEEPDLEDDIAAAVVAQIVERIGKEWRASDERSAADLIRGHFATLRRLASD